MALFKVPNIEEEIKQESQHTLASTMGRSVKLFFLIFFITGGVISGILMSIYFSTTRDDLDRLKEREMYAVTLQYQVIKEIFSSLTSDVHFLSKQNELKAYLDREDDTELTLIATEYKEFSQGKRIYDQVRFIDKTGMERVRVNYNSGTPVVVPLEKLQSKANRYYFEDCFALDRTEIFISPFDLNIEQGKIEQPLKPMIRIGTPVFDDHDQKRGVVLVNYFGSDLLERIKKLDRYSEGHSMLLNDKGYWLLSPYTDQEWGFMFQDEQKTLAMTDPIAWRKIMEGGQGSLETDQGIYSFRTVYPLENHALRSSDGASTADGASTIQVGHDEYHWHVVSFIPTDMIVSKKHGYLVNFFLIGAGLYTFTAIGALITAFAVTKQRLYQDQLKAMALFDPMTNLPNRTLFFDRLSMIENDARRYDKSFCLLYIDLDGFKEINDKMGHEAGDELLKQVGEIFQGVCRKSDTVARIGGDEFAIIYAEYKSVASIKSFADRIIDALAQPITISAGVARIGASIGIACFPEDSDNVEELLSRADKAMYSSKHQGRNNYTLASSLDV